MDENIVRAWVEGWAVSRGAAPPVPAPWGFTIDVGQAAQVTRHVLPDTTEALLRELSGAITVPGTTLKVFEAPETVAPWLAAGWTFEPPGFLMSTRLRATATGVPAGYRLRTWARGGVTRAVVLADDGSFAARGQVADGLPGTVVVDQVETSPAHRRRGLASMVMRTLANVAVDAGVSTGLLGATVEGRALYEHLGWRAHTPLTGIYRAP
ncbi:GNAT family N-acetyltransferase [Longispora sp. K20-0274]|uniref:GNAT family N-acetyltransferase n=1 Tax=Longispora sp. K20-0274 TaxID=3088255 RepID=UPI00399C0C39